MRRLVVAALIGLLGVTAVAQTPPPRPLDELVRAYLWPATDVEFRQAEAALAADPSLSDASRMQFLDLEEIMRQGRLTYQPAPAAVEGVMPLQEFSIDVPGGATVPMLVQLPPRYSPETEWPLMFAMHGGPPSTEEQARKSPERMIRVWTEAAARAGWIVAAPAMLPAVSQGQRSETRLPYEVFHPDQADAVIQALRARYHINPDRIVSTGISLGSNFSLAFACANPGRLAAIVPVSTEGDSRELLLRNLKGTPTYILEGSQDKNIWGIGGPRALNEIVTSFGYDLIYREFGDRAHEGFQEHYPDVLRWLDGRPRENYPHEVLRVSHPAIMPVERQVRWIESDTRQGLVHAVVTGPHRIEVTTRWAREITLYLHDRLVDLDQPVEIWVNGTQAFSARVPRSIPKALERARLLGDERRIYAAVVKVKVPSTPASIKMGEQLWTTLAPRHQEGTLSFWERFAIGALEERFPTLGFDGVEVPAPPGSGLDGEQVAIRITEVVPGSAVAAAGLGPNDLMLEFGSEPVFRGRGGVKGLYQLILRELRAQARDYTMVLWVEGKRRPLAVSLKLGPYAQP